MRIISLATFAAVFALSGAALAQTAPGDPRHVGNYSPTTGIGVPFTRGITMTGAAEVISVGGMKQPIWIYKPEGKGPFPVVVMSSGGDAKGMPETVDWLGSRLKAAGVAAIIPTWRANSPKDDPEDMKMAVTWLQKQPWVAADKIGLYGHSRGGNGAYREAATDPRIKVLVIMGGLVELSKQMEAMKGTPGYTMMTNWLGDPAKDPEGFKKMEAINYVSRIKQPTLIVQGEIDTHVPMTHPVEAKAGIISGGNKNVTLVVMPNMGHFAEFGKFNPAGGNVYGYDELAHIIIPYFKENFRNLSAKK